MDELMTLDQNGVRFPSQCATRALIDWDLIVFLGYDPAGGGPRLQVATGSGVESVPQVSVEKIKALGNELSASENVSRPRTTGALAAAVAES